MMNYARSIPYEYKYRRQFRTGQDEFLDSAVNDRLDPGLEETACLERRVLVASLLDQLDLRERDILTRRFGLGSGSEPMTLQRVGLEEGVSKERIRQLATRAWKNLETWR